MQIAAALAPEWKGGIYYAAQKRSAVTEAEKESTASIALLYESKWRNEDSARAFLRVYAGELPRKYSGLVRRTKDEADESEQVYTTNEGDVLLSIDGDGGLRQRRVSSGACAQAARQHCERAVGWAAGVGGLKAQRQTGHSGDGFDPGLSLVRMMSSAGVMKAAMGRGELSARDDILWFSNSEVADGPGNEELTGLARCGAAG